MRINLKDFKKDDVMAWIFGLGIILSAFDYTYMQIGFAINIVIILNIFNDKKYRSRLSLGSRWVYIPLIIISLSIIIAGLIRFLDDSKLMYFISNIILALYFFSAYLIARLLGKEIFRPFAAIIIIETIATIVINSFINYGYPLGGLVSNYNIATAILVLGTILYSFRGQWIISFIAVVGLFFNGAEEGILAIGIMFIAMIIRRDLSKKVLIPIGLVIIITLLGLYPFGYTKMLYAAPIDKVSVVVFDKHDIEAEGWLETQHPELTDENIFGDDLNYILHYRVEFLTEGLKNLKPMGTGYILIPIDKVDHPIYNIPLVIVQQVGILAAIAWLVVMIYCLIKSKWKYALIMVIGLGIFDNFLFCQLGALWWVIIGVITNTPIKSDLIFRGQNVSTQS